MGVVREVGMAEAEAFVPKVKDSGDSFTGTSPTPSRTLLSSFSIILLKPSKPGLILALLLLTGGCLAQDEEEHYDPSDGGSCLGGMRGERPEGSLSEQGTSTTTSSFWTCDLREGCDGFLTKITTGITGPTPSNDSCPADATSISCSKIIEMNTTCTTCGSPTPLEDNTIIGPKMLCDGDGSFKTVYNQRCTAMKMTNTSSCMVGSEGFSWCSTEHLWWRDDHWFDWDLCSLCSPQSNQVLTTSGFECAGPCHNRHNNEESLAPRCKIKNSELDVDEIGMDFCTSCEGEGCPDENSAPRDERPGSEVGQISWMDGKEEEEPSEDEESADRAMDYDDDYSDFGSHNDYYKY